MRIEHFEPGDQDRPVILIYGNEPRVVKALLSAVRTLSQGSQLRVAVHELPGFESVDGCELFFFASNSDRGVQFIASPRSFECSIRPLWWENVVGLLEPFCSPHASHCHQYLDYGWHSDFQLIISTDRSW